MRSVPVIFLFAVCVAGCSEGSKRGPGFIAPVDTATTPKIPEPDQTVGVNVAPVTSADDPRLHPKYLALQFKTEGGYVYGTTGMDVGSVTTTTKAEVWENSFAINWCTAYQGRDKDNPHDLSKLEDGVVYVELSELRYITSVGQSFEVHPPILRGNWKGGDQRADGGWFGSVNTFFDTTPPNEELTTTFTSTGPFGLLAHTGKFPDKQAHFWPTGSFPRPMIPTNAVAIAHHVRGWAVNGAVFQFGIDVYKYAQEPPGVTINTTPASSERNHLQVLLSPTFHANDGGDDKKTIRFDLWFWTPIRFVQNPDLDPPELAVEYFRPSGEIRAKQP